MWSHASLRFGLTAGRVLQHFQIRFAELAKDLREGSGFRYPTPSRCGPTAGLDPSR